MSLLTFRSDSPLLSRTVFHTLHLAIDFFKDLISAFSPALRFAEISYLLSFLRCTLLYFFFHLKNCFLLKYCILLILGTKMFFPSFLQPSLTRNIV